MVTTTNLVVLLGIMLLASLASLAVASPQSERTTGRRLYGSTWVIWSIVALVVQFVIVKWWFHPLSYIIFTGVICLMEIITIRVPKDRPLDETEEPAMRFFAWLLLSLGPMASMVIAAKIATPKGSWAFEGRTIFLYCLVPAAVIGVGVIRIASCGSAADDYEDDDDYDDYDEELDEVVAEMDDDFEPSSSVDPDEYVDLVDDAEGVA